MKQQTAVEWLLENIHIIPKFKLSVQDTIDKAKQMEKEQIINAHGLRYSDITEETVKGEEYYNKTYSQEPKKEYGPSKKYLEKQKELMEDFIWNKMNKL
jgi:hypothetical protein